MKASAHIVAALVVALSALCTSTTAHADYGEVRGDHLQSGRAAARGAIDTARIVWRFLLGRFAYADRMTFADCDGDLRSDVLSIEGTGVVARHWNGQSIWRVVVPGVRRFERIVDLDGDGPHAGYLVASAGDGRIHLISLVGGAIAFSTEQDELSKNSQLSQSRVGDVDGDGLPDLVLTGFTGRTLVLRADGMGGIETRALPVSTVADEQGRRPYYAPYGSVLADVDGDDVLEIVLVGRRVVRVYDGRTGLPELGPAPVLGGHPLLQPDGTPIDPEQYGKVHAQVVPGPDGHDRVLLSVDEARFGRRLFVLAFVSDPDPDVWGRMETSLYWEVDDRAVDLHRRLGDAVADFDGDGWPEIVTGARIAGRDAVRIFTTAPEPGGPLGAGCVAAHDAQPALVGCLTDQRPVGLWHAADGPLLVTVDDERTTAWTLSWEGGRFQPRSVDGIPPTASLVKGHDIETTGAVSARWLPLRSGVDGGLLVTVDGRIERLTMKDGALVRTPSVSDLPFDRFWARTGARGVPELVGLDPGGALVPFDRDLRPHRTRRGAAVRLRAPGWTGATGITRQAQSAAFAGGRSEQIAMVDANLDLMIIDAGGASQAVAANVLRTHPGAWRAALVDVDLDARPDVLAVQGDALVAFGSDGQRLFSTPFMGPQDRVQRSLITAGDGDGFRIFAVTSSQDDGHSTVHAFDRRGERLWAHRSEFPTRGSNLGFPLADGFDGEGPGALYIPFGSRLYRFTADSGARVDAFEWSYPNWVVAVRGPEGAATHLVTEQDQVRRVELETGVEHGAVADFQAAERPLVVLTCPDGRVVATGIDDASTVRTFDVHRDHEYPPLYLSAGGVVGPEAPSAGRLGDPTGIDELVDGRPGVAVGSTDGHLYTLYPCGTPGGSTDPTLAWSHDFGAAVGVPIFADADGDLHAELVVPVADGYIYGVAGTHALGVDAPEWIVDVPPGEREPAPEQEPEQGPEQEPADIDTTDAEHLAAAWDAVDGAHYQYTVLDADDVMLGAWVLTDEPHGTWEMGLVEGSAYRFVVRAVSAVDGRSEEVISDGVFYRPTPPEELLACEQDPLCSGCDCNVGRDARAQPSTVGFALFVLLLGVRRGALKRRRGR